jgi:hypothetical protein
MADTRDNFSKNVVRTLQERVGNRCSNPTCRCLTSGPNDADYKATRIGVGAHITAAAPGGPRYDPTLTPEERSSITNGIWLCQNCSTLVDSDPSTYPVSMLLEWRQCAEDRARQELEGSDGASSQDSEFEGFDCPYCGTAMQYGREVCLGCHAEVVYGSTYKESLEDSQYGMIFGGGGAVLFVFGLPSWLATSFSWPLSPGLGIGLYSIIVVAAIAFATGVAFVRNGDTRRRQQSPPRFFRASILQPSPSFQRTDGRF